MTTDDFLALPASSAPLPTSQPAGADLAVARRLLIIGCTRRKRAAAVPLPALDLYDGPAFRLLRRYLRSGQDEVTSLDVAILSGRHGVLAPDDLVLSYDQRLTTECAVHIAPLTQAAIVRLLIGTQYAATYVDVGQTYVALVPARQTLRMVCPSVTFSAGSLGLRLARLHDWLYGAVPSQPVSLETSWGDGARPVILRGVHIRADREGAFAIARRSLAEGCGDPHAYEAWYVTLDAARVAPKWLVSQISGLPPSAFGSGEARRVLARLGIAVVRA